MTPRALLLMMILGCASSTEPAAAPEPPGPEPLPQPAPAPATASAAGTQNPCDQLEPEVFDVTDIDARTDLSDAQKEQAKREQAERRRVLFECFERAMKEKQQLEPTSP